MKKQKGIKRMKQTRKALAALFISTLTILPTGLSIAATQGTLGSTSTGTANVTLTIPSLYRISGLTDLSLGTYSGSGTMTANEDVCVYSNVNGTYRVNITGNSTLSPAAFAVQNAGNTAYIPMAVKWNGVIGTTGNAAITYNVPLAATGANQTTTDCSTGGLSADLQVSLLQSDLLKAPASVYSSILTILIEP